MKRSFLTLALVGLASTAWAQLPLSHPNRMRKCAAEWQAQKRSANPKVTYQQFMSGCMKSVAASGGAPMGK